MISNDHCIKPLSIGLRFLQNEREIKGREGEREGGEGKCSREENKDNAGSSALTEMKMQNLSAPARVFDAKSIMQFGASLILFTDFLTPSVVLLLRASLRRALRANRSRQFDLLLRGKGLKSCAQREKEKKRKEKKGSWLGQGVPLARDLPGKPCPPLKDNPLT